VEGLTDEQKLLYSSEFRFNYWRTESEHRFYTVRMGVKRNDGRWGINDGGAFGACWDGKDWGDELRGPDAYRYDLDEALVITKRLAFEENQRIVAIMEARFPGQFRGGPYDMASGRTLDLRPVDGS
jgi:hypothetical protein